MLVSGKNHIRVRRVQVFPQSPELRMHSMAPEDPAAEERVVSIRDDAGAAMISQVLA
jgi:hypothetical protein